MPKDEKKLQQAHNRFDVKVTKSSDCWIWTGGGDRHGYGRFWYDGKMQLSHRVNWLLHNGPIPDGLCVLHTCDNPPCVNPAHLWLGTQADNMHDCANKGRAVGGISRGQRHGLAKLTDDKVLEIRRIYSAGGTTQRELAGAFEVSQAVINYILLRKTWAHI